MQFDVSIVAGGKHRRVRVEGRDHDTVGGLQAAAKTLLGPGDRLFCNGRPLESAARLEDVELIAGSTLSAEATPATETPMLESLPKLHARVVGGRQAGRVFPIHAGTASIGREATRDIVLDDAMASRWHADLDVSADGTVRIADHESANGVLIEGNAIAAPTTWRLGERVELGATLLQLGAESPERLNTVPAGPLLEVHRRFRGAHGTWRKRVDLEKPPAAPRPPGTWSNLALAILPAILMVAVGLISGQTSILIFAAVSPVIGIGRAFTQQRTYKRAQRDDVATFEGKRAEHLAQIDESRRDETATRLDASPDLAALAINARLPSRRLWERKMVDADFLSLRLGTASRAPSIEIAGDDIDLPPLWRVPVTVDLREVMNLSLVGPSPMTRAVAASLVLQFAVNNEPREVKVVVISDDEDAWSWVGWLAHNRWSSDEVFNLVGSDKTSVASRLKELSDLVTKRAAQAQGSDKSAFAPAVVVVLENAGSPLAGAFQKVLTDGPAVGVHAICLDENHVPEQCRARFLMGVGLDGEERIDQCTFEQQGVDSVEEVLADTPDPETLDLVARALAPLQAATSSSDAARELPANARLLDVLELPNLSPDDIRARWAEPSADANATIGLSGKASGGTLDISLTRDGPHALVAGTTRSGKSEFIKTLVAACALNYHPDDMQFLFIDFKGGADYRLVKELPHAVALCTNESAEQLEEFQRAMRLLNAEIGRRRRLFEIAKTVNIEGYATARRGDRSLPPVGRLVVIADEFSELAQKARDQLDELVTVAKTGASSGVHLFLATQNPAGCVTNQIDANVALRICFRVKGRDESNEVIGAPEAGEIQERHRGRAFLRAHSNPLVEFQCARVAGARPGSAAEDTPLSAQLCVWHEVGHVPAAAGRDAEVPDYETDLADVLAAVQRAVSDEAWDGSAVPWPDSLPDYVALDELPAVDDPLTIPFALADDVANQTRSGIGMQLGTGHLAIGGSHGEGRTTALRTLACCAATRLPPSALHVYLIDFSGGGLRPLSNLPHVAASTFDDFDHASRILRELETIVKERLALFAAKGYARLDDQRRASEQPLPYVLVCFDDWDAFADGAARLPITEQFIALLAKGPSVGVYAAISGERGLASGRINRQITTRYVLRFNDSGSYDAFGVNDRDLPSKMPPGRMLVTKSAVLAHVATVGGSTAGSVDAILALGRQLRERHADVKHLWPRRMEPLSREISLAQVVERAGPEPTMILPIVFGVSGETGSSVFVDAAARPGGIFVCGPPGSGKTNALAAIGELLIGRGMKVAVVNPGDSAIVKLNGVAGITRSRHVDATFATETAAQILLIDDAELLDVNDEYLQNLARGEAAVPVVAAFSVDVLAGTPRGWAHLVKQGRTGLLLCPRNRYDSAVFDAPTFDEALLPKDPPPGRAIAGVRGRLEIVQVPKATL